MTDFSDIFSKKADLHIKPGLQRISRAFKFLGSPSYNIPTIVVGGTNGKGSVCAFLAYFFEKLNFKVGLYTSPHLIHFSERIYVSSQNIDDAYLRQELNEIQNILPKDIIDDLSFFEIATLIALKVFEKSKTQINIFEVGMGGRYDAVNILDPLVSVIVTVSMDHKQYLGNTLAKIAYEKAGIMRPQKSVFLGMSYEDTVYDEALQVILDVAKNINTKPYLMNNHYGVLDENNFYIKLDKNRFEFRFPQYLKNKAFFLKKNYCLAAAVFWYYCTEFLSYKPSTLMSFLNDVSQFKYPQFSVIRGRDQKLKVCFNNTFQYFLIDVCHNIEGVKAFQESLYQRYGNIKFCGFVSILKDKDLNEMLDILRTFIDPIWLFKINSERSWNSLDLNNRHKDLTIYYNFAQALQKALNQGCDVKTPWIICGSVLAVGEVLEFFNVKTAGDYDDELLGECYSFNI